MIIRVSGNPVIKVEGTLLNFGFSHTHEIGHFETERYSIPQ